MPEDAALLERWSKNDQRAGEALVARYFKQVSRFFRNKAGDDCEDLIQRTFLGCLEGCQRFRGSSSFRAFLFGVARNVLFEHLREKAQQVGREFDHGVSSIGALDPTPSQVAVRHEGERRLCEALRQIPVELQLALELHYWEDLSTAELAEILQIPQGTVKSRLGRARRELRHHLERAAVPSTVDIDQLRRDMVAIRSSR